jgi:type I restriction enzyme S subunit
MSNKQKTSLVPMLRFPAFRDFPEWKAEKVDELVDTVTPPKKLPTSSYSSKGALPIIDQSQNAICGWTDDHDALTQDNLPLIIFGDHTCILKLVDRPFAQGADGIKILKSRSTIGAKYLYQYLSYKPVVTEEYKRHYSILKEKVVLFPDFKTGEQQKIADCLGSLDELIAAQVRKVDALKIHKKGLMQQLFPREGETQPRLRFPEFRDAGGWSIFELGNVSDVRDGTHDSPEFFTSGRPLVTSKNLKSDGTLDLENVSLISEQDYEQINKRSKVSVGDILFGMIGTIGNPVLIKSEGFAIKNVALIKQLGPLMNSFVVQLLQSDYVAAIFAVLNTGNSQKFIALGKIRGLPVPVPLLLEQQRIADCLTSLDNFITAATQQLETLKTHKKGLMQQLFPVLEDGQK